MKKLICFVIMLMLVCSAAMADEAELVVSGSGTVYMQADLVSASLGVTMSGEDLAGVQQQANATVNAICEALKNAGLDEDSISTNYIYINPRYEYISDSSMANSGGEQQVIVGYTVNNSMTIVTSEIDKIGAYIDAAFAAGANTFDSINFSVVDDTQARNQALELAVEDARRKAEIIAAASGKVLGEIERITEGNSGGYYANGTAGGARFAMVESAAYDAGTTVRAAQINISAQVEICYELK